MRSTALSHPTAPTSASATVTYRLVSEAHGGSAKRTYSRIEEASTDAEKDPDVDCQRESEGERDINQRACVRGTVTEQIVGNLCGCKCEEQEEKGADELAQTGNEHVADSVGEPAEARQALLPRAVGVFGVSCFHAGQDHGGVEALGCRVDAARS
jgi:hypothetical protein